MHKQQMEKEDVALPQIRETNMQKTLNHKNSTQH